MLWQIDVHPAPGQPDRQAQRLAADAADLGITGALGIRTAHGYLVEGELAADQIHQVASQLFCDPVVQQVVVAPVGDGVLNSPPDGPSGQLVYVLPKPGVMDPVAQSAIEAIADLGLRADAVRTFKKYWIDRQHADQLPALCSRLLANDSVEQVVLGALHLDRLAIGTPYTLDKKTVPLLEADDRQLDTLSRQGHLYLSRPEMQAIQAHYRGLGREPTDVELETIAQTWSEHCSHKTLAGRIAYRDERGSREFTHMLRETIFAATQAIRARWGADDWCVSVFEDNAGVIRFDDRYHLAFKVETHNHPSAIEPYGGANTGLGGVIRDALGTGLGARPICNTDVFCFAPPDTPAESLPPGVLHPRRVMKGVVAGVRDYGNRMGIPTVNGAIYFDPRYLGNPLVFCGNVGLIPRDLGRKQPHAGDLIVTVGGRTGRDGIHGATFSSAELTSQSETVSGGAVQIGNPITEKMMTDVLMEARDRGLYRAITDCGAGGYSSAVGEMGAAIGAEVWLEKVPLKYEGLSYTEIWISEAQERMVLAVPPENWEELERLCLREGVEATVIGRFAPTGRLRLLYQGETVGDLAMDFLHDGRPPVVRQAVYHPEPTAPLEVAARTPDQAREDLLRLLASWNIASKHWVIRQYDHEVQGGSVIKPLVGVMEDGPSDAAVVRPVLDSYRGIVLACGAHPRLGDLDPYAMAASSIDEAIRNCVAVGADPRRIALLDNFCWGYTDRPETLGSLVRAALACHDLAVELETPFISGKDSLNNEFTYEDAEGTRHTISIPPTLLISALGQVEDVHQCVTMDLKSPGSRLYAVGETRAEMGGSHFAAQHGLSGGHPPQVDPARTRRLALALHQAIRQGLVRACHDMSEGGFAVSLAEMAFAGGWGAEVSIDRLPQRPGPDPGDETTWLLFSESNTRWICEVPVERAEAFEGCFAGLPLQPIGQVIDQPLLKMFYGRKMVLEASLSELKAAWQKPLDW